MRMFCDVFTQHIHMGNIYIHHGEEEDMRNKKKALRPSTSKINTIISDIHLLKSMVLRIGCRISPVIKLRE